MKEWYRNVVKESEFAGRNYGRFCAVNVRTDKLFLLLTPNADELRTASQISGMNSWTWFL